MERRGAVCLSSIEGECEANIIEKYLTTYVGKSISYVKNIDIIINIHLLLTGEKL